MRHLLFAAFFSLSPTAILAAEAEIRLHVTGLTCPSCSYIVATALKSVGTVEVAEFVEGKAEDGVYVLHYDDAVTDPDQLIVAVTGVGYGATSAPEGGS